MVPQETRREFVKSTVASAIIGLGVWSETTAAASTSPSQKLSIGAIGVGNRGVDNITASSNENIVALCDVDQRYLNEMSEFYPRADKFHDFREMLEQTDLDAVLISTPDHTHFHAAMMAMRKRLHVYVEKPLAHSIEECRILAKTALELKVVTQMGNQHHSSAGYRRVVELVQSGTIGDVREVHSWTTRPLWSQGVDRPKEQRAVPKELNWDLWLGPARERPYHPAYHPRTWRGWWDFGCGALGDMGPHLIDPAFWALKLDSPISIEAESSSVNDESAPEWSIVRFEFPKRGNLPPVKLTWYDGGKQPPEEITSAKRPPANGTLIIGSRAKVFAPELGARPIVVSNDKSDKIEQPESSIPVPTGHQDEWLRACKGEGKTGSDFTYASKLTELCLLGNIAIRCGQRIEWDSQAMKVLHCQRANELLSREYRSGWNDV